MRTPRPSFSSFSVALSQTPRSMHLPKHRQRRNSQKPTAVLPPIQHDGFVQPIDERDHLSRQCLDLPSAFIFEHDNSLVSLREALDTNKVDRSTAKGRRLSLSTLIIDLAFAIKRKCYQFCDEKCESVVDIDLLT